MIVTISLVDIDLMWNEISMISNIMWISEIDYIKPRYLRVVVVVSGAAVVVVVVVVVVVMSWRLPAESSGDGSVIGLSERADDSSAGFDDESAFSTVSFFSSAGGAIEKSLRG